jgi:hypothetical protein
MTVYLILLGSLGTSGKTNWRGRLSTVNLLVLSGLDQLLFILIILLTLFTKQATIIRRSTVLSLPLWLVLPGYAHNAIFTLAKVTRQCQDNNTWHKHTCTCLGHLGRSDRDRCDPIYVASPKVGKASIVTCHWWLSSVTFADSFADKRRQCKRSIKCVWN